MAEYFTKRGRYQTLMGDTIEKGFLKKAFKSADLTTSLIAAGAIFTMIQPEPPLLSAAKILGLFAFQSALYRAVERTTNLRPFPLKSKDNTASQNEKPKQLVIDTTPEHKDTVNSLKKHGQNIQEARWSYYTDLAAYSATILGSAFLTASLTDAETTTLKALAHISAIFPIAMVRPLLGARRFNKLAKGEWAIIDEPEGGQKTVKKHLFNTPNLSPKPTHAPVPAPTRN